MLVLKVRVGVRDTTRGSDWKWEEELNNGQKRGMSFGSDRGPGSSMESQARDITPYQTSLRPEVKVKAKEKQNTPASSE